MWPELMPPPAKPPLMIGPKTRVHARRSFCARGVRPSRPIFSGSTPSRGCAQVSRLAGRSPSRASAATATCSGVMSSATTRASAASTRSRPRATSRTPAARDVSAIASSVVIDTLVGVDGT